MNWEWVSEKLIPVAWLLTASILIGAEVGCWLR